MDKTKRVLVRLLTSILVDSRNLDSEHVLRIAIDDLSGNLSMQSSRHLLTKEILLWASLRLNISVNGMPLQNFILRLLSMMCIAYSMHRIEAFVSEVESEI